MSLRSKRIGIASSILLIALGIIVALVHQHNSVSAIDLQTADYVAANNVAARSDYLKIVQLKKAVIDQDHKNALAQQDVDWLLAFANNPRYRGKARGLRQMYVSGVFIFAGLDQLPTACRQSVYDFGVELVHDPDLYGLSNPQAGCRILGNLRNKSAIPELQALLQSQNRQTRRFAALALDHLGVEVPPSVYINHA